MANHKSAKKRIRQTLTRKLRNKYQHKTTRTAIKKLKEITTQKEAEVFYPEVSSMIDKLSKNNVIHKNKAANLKSKLKIHVNSLTGTTAKKEVTPVAKKKVAVATKKTEVPKATKKPVVKKKPVATKKEAPKAAKPAIKK